MRMTRSIGAIALLLALGAPSGAFAQSAASGTVGNPASTQATQVGGRDSSGNLRVPRVDSSGNLSTAVTSSSLPTGASTAAKQPAPGTAGSASADVITVQGIAGGTPLIVGGNVASAAADSGNPVKVGGKYNATVPTFTDGQRGDLQLDSRGNARTVATTVLTDVIDGWPNAQIGLSPANSGHTGYGIPARSGYVFNSSTWDRQRGDANGTVVQPALASAMWSYAAASGGISNTTTAVTVKTAAGASVRNYVTALQCNSTALGAATELAIRDGAGGTVLWRGQIGTAGWLNGWSMAFAVPLKGTANTLVEVVTLTASVSGAVYCNLQGFTGL